MNTSDSGARTGCLRLLWQPALLVTALLAFCSISRVSQAADTNVPAPASASVDDTNSLEMLRASLQLQEQLHALQLTIEESRRAGDASAAKNEEAIANRLQAIEQALAAQRARDLEQMQSSNRVLLIVAETFAALGLMALLLMAYFQWRTVGRLADLSAAIHPVPQIGPGTAIAALGPGQPDLGNGASTEQSTARLLGSIDLLEQRIRQLENTAQPPLPPAAPTANGLTAEPGKPASASTDESVQTAAGDAASNVSADTVKQTGESEKNSTAPKAPTPAEKPRRAAESQAGVSSNGERVTMLLGKGQSLLNMEQNFEALACFDEALSIEPTSTEALVRKGTALERLRKLNEALECYDRAIAADSSLTIAYLYKGGLFNRMERFSEALDCYEKALRSQSKAKGKRG